jgi:hypothetical protein
MAAINRFLTSLRGSTHGSGKRRILYGHGRSLPAVVSGLYVKLDRLRQLYGADQVEEILDGIIERKKRLNRLVELQSKTRVTINEHEEIHMILRQFRRRVPK